ncbi:putative nucleic acid-binding protein [Kribbella aluminosa]|uniref:Nucleic acid-binding protein n=1 Tax=Kribbella aluminosa TaxID=416017 RepID=A0ABS4V151_9ACTN|nr:putative nucleic acid-binding protein [Kribbella aluminosa]
MIAAIALSHGVQVATRNVAHFAGFGVEVVNPWDE